MPDSGFDDIQVRLVQSLDDALALKRWLGERHASWTLGLDTETTGLDHQRDTVRLVQVGDDRTGWAIPAGDWRGLVREIIAGYEGDWSGWNSKYDEHMLERYCGVSPRRYHDGSICAHAVDPLARRALKDTAGRLVDPRAAQLDRRLDEQMAANRWDWATVPIEFPTYWAYGALDPVLTVRCFEQLHARVVADGQEDLYELELQAQRVCKKIENRGIRVDRDYCARREEVLEAELLALRERTLEEYGFHAGQRDMVIARMMRDGWEPTIYTKTGKPSIGKAGLIGCTHPLAVIYRRKKELEVRAHNYFRNLWRYSEGGYIHCTVNPLQAKTGRMSIEKPSLHNQPRSQEVRDAFLAREGHRLLTADFAQIELRLLAWLAREPAMIAFFQEGRDMPTEVARAVFEIPDDTEVLKPLRQQVKSTLYSLAYGAGAAKIGLVLGVGEEGGRQFLERLFGLYPRLGSFSKQVQRVAVERSYDQPEVFSPTLRRRYYVNGARKAYKLVNYLIQGEAGIAFKRQLVALDNAGVGDLMVLVVHDEVIWDVPEEQVEEVARVAAEVMPDTRTYAPVPLAVEVAPPLERWGTKYAGFEPTPVLEFDEDEEEPEEVAA